MKKILHVVLIILSLTPVIWFAGKPGVVINGVDTNFPLDPILWFLRRFFVWNPTVNGGMDFSSSTAGIFFHLGQTIFYFVGLNLETTQLLHMVFWFTLIIFSSFYLAKSLFPKSIVAQLVFVSLYSFNIYLFNTWENVKVANLSLVSAIPFFAAVLHRLIRGEIKPSVAYLMFAASGVVLSGAGINPAYFLCFYLVSSFFVIGLSWEGRKIAVIKESSKGFLIVFLVNMFWILPTVFFIWSSIGASSGIVDIGFTNWIDSLSENTSLINVLRLQGAWDWYSIDNATGTPLFIPYAGNYFYRLPFVVFSFLIPIIALVSLIFRNSKKRGWYVIFSIMTVVGVFLGAGTHEPTGTIFSFLWERIPFLNLFRSPWYIFTPLTIIGITGLVCLFIENESKKVSKPIIFLIASAIFVGNLFYSYPLVTGKIFRPNRYDTFYVKFPKHVFDTKAFFDQNPPQGRIIGYPEDEIEKFSWGYRGIESILQLLIQSETLYRSLNASNAPISTLIYEFYDAVKKNEKVKLDSLADVLDIEWFFYKKDQESLSPSIGSSIESFEKKSFGSWDVYKINEAQKMKVVDGYVSVEPYSDAAKVAGLLSRNQVIVNPDDSEYKKIAGFDNPGTRIIVAKNSHQNVNEDKSRELNPQQVEYTFATSIEGEFVPVLERFRLEAFGLNPTSNLEVLIDSVPTTLFVANVSDSYVKYRPINLSPGQHAISFSVVNSSVLADFRNKITLFNQEDKDKESTMVVKSINYFSPLLVSVSYKHLFGERPQIVVTQRKSDGGLIKAQREVLPPFSELQTRNFIFDPVKTESGLLVSLIAPFEAEVGTKVEFEMLQMHSLFINNMFFVQQTPQVKQEPTPSITYKRVSPTHIKGEVKNSTGPVTILFAENYSPHWQMVVKNAKLVSHFNANLYANAWNVAPNSSDFSFDIYYQPQKLFVAGGLFSVATIVGLFIYWISRKNKHA